LGDHDCGARLAGSSIDPAGGHDRRACEAIQVSAGHGSRLLLAYRLPPSRIIRELQASVWMRAAEPGGRIGFRIQYPYLRDAGTGQAVTTVVFGESYRRGGVWQALQISSIQAGMRARENALRVEYGAQSDLRDAFVDALVVDVYHGPGQQTVYLDDVRVEQMVPVGSVGGAAASAQPPAAATRTTDARRAASATTLPAAPSPALFPGGRLWRIIEHNGEPLEWLQTLGFNAVLLSQPPTAEILREASQAGMKLYAPPPTTLQPAIEPLLEPVAGWYLGTSLDATAWAETDRSVDRLERLPPLWQRPLLAAPVEQWSRYATRLTGMLYDLPPPLVGLSGDEESGWLGEQIQRTRRPLPVAVGIPTGPPAQLIEQLTAMARSVGAPREQTYPWHPLWLQTVRALEHAPQAVVFRSRRSLTSGGLADQRRALALGYINRMLQLLGPLVAAGSPGEPLVCRGAAYRGRQLRLGDSQLLLLSTTQTSTTGLRAGDGEVLEIELPPGSPSQFAWRLGSFHPARLELQQTPQATSLQIVAPDVTEWIVVSVDPSLGTRLQRAAQPLAQMAAIDRWQLASEQVLQVREDWRAAASGRLVRADTVPRGMLTGAANALSSAEPLFRSGDASASLRLTKRADAWSLHAARRWQQAILPAHTDRISFPPAFASSTAGLQLSLLPQLERAGWSGNRLAGGTLDQPDILQRTGWTYDRRIEPLAPSTVGISQGLARRGDGCLRVEVTGHGDGPLPGGYAGTAVRVRSPAVNFQAEQAVRIDAQIRTLGFGAPYQGVLVYDNLGGPEMGVLVRAAERWTHVRLFRYTPRETPVHVMFEVIGSGEAFIDDVEVANWETVPAASHRFRPISARSSR